MHQFAPGIVECGDGICLPLRHTRLGMVTGDDLADIAAHGQSALLGYAVGGLVFCFCQPYLNASGAVLFRVGICHFGCKL